MGKFGGAELTYGADLDVMFVGENTRAAQALVVEMGRTTAEGNIFLLDARLRPDGEKGTLTCERGGVRSVLLDARAAVGNSGAHPRACAFAVLKALRSSTSHSAHGA